MGHIPVCQVFSSLALGGAGQRCCWHLAQPRSLGLLPPPLTPEMLRILFALSTENKKVPWHRLLQCAVWLVLLTSYRLCYSCPYFNCSKPNLGKDAAWPWLLLPALAYTESRCIWFCSQMYLLWCIDLSVPVAKGETSGGSRFSMC